jgi:hypothetical protein
MAAAGIVVTVIFVGVTVGVLISNRCPYYYVNDVCYKDRRYVPNGECDSTTTGCCWPNEAVYIFDGTDGYCYIL